MDSRFLLGGEAKVKNHRKNNMGAARSSAPSSSSSSSTMKAQIRKYKYRAIEYACSACLLCVSCPLSIFCCCIKVPCKIGSRAVERAKACCCVSDKKVFATYSSFSDIDSDSLPQQRVVHTNNKNFDAQKSKILSTNRGDHQLQSASRNKICF